MYESKTSLIVHNIVQIQRLNYPKIQDKQPFILFIGPFLSRKNLHMASVHVKGRWSVWIFALA